MKTPKSVGYFKSYDGTKIYYEVRGEGKPIVLCYGIGCLINHWIHQIKYFSQGYQTVVFDYRGHHNSGMPTDRGQLSFDSHAQDIRGLLNHLQIEKASFWGHSFGAQVVVRTYDMFPEMFENIVFINGFARNPISGMFGTDFAESFFKFFKSGYNQMPETLSYLWRKGVTNPLAVQMSALAGGFNIELTRLNDIEIYARGVAAMDLNAFMELFENMMNYDGSPVLERINRPTLIIGGKKDSVTPQSFQEDMHLKIKGSQFIMIPYGSHCTQLDMPDFVNLKIDQFLLKNKYGPKN